MTPRTLRWRILLATLGSLIFILLWAGVALDKAFQRVARSNMHEQLENLTYALLGATEIDTHGDVLIPPQLPQSKINTPGSGRYALILNGKGETVWRSPSSLGEHLLLIEPMPPGHSHFESHRDKPAQPFVFRFGSVWGRPTGEDINLTFVFVQDKTQYLTEILRYRETLIQWLGGGAFIVILFHTWFLLRELKPLRRVVREVEEIEQGRSTHIKGRYPSELSVLSERINAFISNERAQTKSYRHAVDDLAHSLKTPIAVIRGIDISPGNNEQSSVLAEQVDRISEIIDYHLQRAAAAGKTTMGRQRTPFQPIAEKILNSLQKVYSDKGVHAELDCDEQLLFPGEKDDLYEMLGNLTDNAFKWCKQTIQVSAFISRENDSEQFVLTVSDDGPGIPDDLRKEITHRGVRGDHQTPGQGIGMAVIQSIVRSYNGTLAITTSRLGGAGVEISLDNSSTTPVR